MQELGYDVVCLDLSEELLAGVGGLPRALVDGIDAQWEAAGQPGTLPNR